MDLEEVYTLVGHHFGNGCNTDIFLAKLVLIILSFVFVQVVSDGFIYNFRHSIVPLILQVLEHKTVYLIFRMTAT